MILLLIRIFPALLPILYFFTIKIILMWPVRWWLPAIIFTIVNFFFFYLMLLKINRKRIWFLFLYSEIFGIIGILYALFLSNNIFVNLFIVGWSIIYYVYLEAIFNYLLRTEKRTILEIKNITGFTSPALVFLTSYTLLAFNVFLYFSVWWLTIIYFVIIFIVSYDRLLVYGFKHIICFYYASVFSLILAEIIIVLLWWTTSLYVLALIPTLVFYLASSFVVLYLSEQLKWKIAIQYIVIVFLILTGVLITASWI